MVALSEVAGVRRAVSASTTPPDLPYRPGQSLWYYAKDDKVRLRIDERLPFFHAFGD